MTKAIIGISDRREAFADLREIARRIDAGEKLPPADYRLNFSTAAQLFAELSPKRMEILEILKRSGPVSVYKLAKMAGRNYSNVHGDVARLMQLDLVAKDEEGRVFVPWEEVDIHVSLTGTKAA